MPFDLGSLLQQYVVGANAASQDPQTHWRRTRRPT